MSRLSESATRRALDPSAVQLYHYLMDLVIDTSAIIAVIANEPERPAIVEHTIGANLVAPASVHWEVGNAFSAMFKRRRITLDQAKQAIESYEQMPIRFVDVDLGQSLELCDRLGVYAYDSYLLTCALKLRSPILTLDEQLIGAAPLVGVSFLEIRR